MNSWWRRIRGAVGTGITWAIVWAPIAVVVGTQIIDPTNAMDEMWVIVGALPGFVSGVIFSAVLGFSARRRRLAELSVPRVGAWGALAGMVTGIIPFMIGSAPGNAWVMAATVIPILALLSGLSAAGSLALAQRAERSEMSDDTSNDEAVNPMELTSNGATRSINAGNALHENQSQSRPTPARDASIR